LQLTRLRIRLGSMNLKIAAIAMSRGAIVLSRDLTDFRRAAGLNVEDWTQGEQLSLPIPHQNETVARSKDVKLKPK
jgi:hypothetical protein